MTKENFRASIYIDLPGNHREDRLTELRIGPLLMRMTGPCLRCNVVWFNWKTGKPIGEMEPYSTLSATRTVKGLGICFGVYH